MAKKTTDPAMLSHPPGARIHIKAGEPGHPPAAPSLLYVETHNTLARMGVQVISSYDQFKQVTGGDKVVVIDFWATWCGPCKMIGPIFEKISETPAGEKIGFYKVDVDEQSQISSEVGIRAMPSFVFFKNGEKVETVVGADPSKLQVCIQSTRAWLWEETAPRRHGQD